MRGREAAIDPSVFRRVMGRFATGVTVVSSAVEGEIRCMTANAFMSGSLEPPLCVISVGVRARMHRFLDKARHFGVNVLSEKQEECSLHFSGKPIEGLAPEFEYVAATPLLVGRLAAVAARVTAIHPCGDHSLFIGEIFHMSAAEKGKPLVLYGGRYAALVSPSHPSLPTPEFW